MRLIALFTLSLTLACSSRTSDGDSSETDSGEASTNAGEEADATEGSDPELEQLCLTGCERFALCAPETYVVAYADDQACFDYCYDTFSATPTCREAAGPYAACTASLECEQWPALLEDPATSACAEEWAVAGPACGLI